MSEGNLPMWRRVLNWGCVLYFLGLPAMVILLGYTHTELFSGEIQKGARQFLASFHLSVSALVAAMAGLNSFDRYKSNGHSSNGRTNGGEKKS